MAQIISFVSGKGGVGKSVLTAGIAAALSKMGSRVLAIDCNFGMRSLDLLLGVEETGVYNMQDVLSGSKKVSDVISHHHIYKNLDFIPASNEADDKLVTAFNLYSVLSQCEDYDYILLDCPTGLSKIHSEIAAVCSTVILVATPDFTSVRDADKTAQSLDSADMRLIINRMEPELIRKYQFSNIDEIIDATAVQLIGVVPEDENIRIESNLGLPVCEVKTQGGICINNIAKRLCGENIPLYKFK